MAMRYPGGLIAPTPVNANYPSGVWTPSQSLPYQQQNVWTRDQYWPYTTLLLQGNGTNGAQNNTFLDSSSNTFSITRNGNTTQGSFTPYEANGYWSNYFDGSGDYLTASANSAFAFGTGDLTVEFWVYTLATPGVVAGIYDVGTTNTSGRFVIDYYSDQKVKIETAGSTLVSSSTNLPLNSWVHIAAVRSGTTMSLYQNGVRVGTATNSTNFSQNSPWIGQSLDGYAFTGYISNVRVVKGTAVYDPTQASITVPTAPLTNITNTSLLTCQSNRFIDNSASPLTITVNGNPSVQAFQPFPGATTWSASVLGGSGYFDGNGDYLTGTLTGQTPGTGDLTVEFWVYRTATQACTVFNTRSGDTTDGIGIEIGSTNALAVTFAGDTFIVTANGSVPLNSWSHIAVVRSSGNFQAYINGVAQVSPVTRTNNFTSTNLTIGYFSVNAPYGTTYLTGYLSCLRYTKTAVYTSNFTPPTSPPTNIANTVLLLNFTNAGIFDSAMMNDLETAGNAQVSTSIVKYGTGSMYFDGSGDWLIIPYSQNINFGTGNFTIEGWFYLSSFANQYYVLGGTWTTGSSDEWLVQIENNGTMRFLTSAGTSFYTAGITTGTWYHFAAVRNGSTVTLYVNGSSVGSYTNSNSIGSTSKTLYIGVQNNGAAWPWNGYIDDLRITKGVARYISTFTPPPARMPQQ
ncbi:MAG: LamG domain-containing protein [Microbacteriaceae bacterium]|nr:LamG domain-containing protein [Microbacteriaceae bacterium]